jgi:glycosyltransferase involved in cell wall biosynthesis
MRIVHFIEFFQPILGYQETYLARSQLQAGHQVTVVTSDRYFPFPSYRSAVEPTLGPRVVGPRSGQEEEGIFTVRLRSTPLIARFLWIHDLIGTVLRLAPDFVHIHTLPNISTMRLARGLARHRVPFLIDEHMLYSVHRSDPLHRFYYRLVRSTVKHFLLDYCRHFIGVAEECSRYLVDVYGVPAERVQTIPLGTDTDSFSPNEVARAKQRSVWAFSADDVAVGYVGKVVPRKGVHELAAAILPLLQINPKLRCVIVGDGPSNYVEGIRDRFVRAGVASQVVFGAPVPNRQLPMVFCGLDVCVWPREASMSLLDAAACELPVVCTDDPVSLERIAGGNGLPFPVGNTNALRQTLAELILNPALRDRLGRLGRRQAIETHSWSQISNQFIRVYEEASATKSISVRSGSPA